MVILIIFPIQALTCVVFSFETEIEECVLYEGSRAGVAIESTSGFTLGFCPKPDNKFFITFNKENIPINIPTDIKSQFWCSENSGSLCNFPFFGSGEEGNTDVFFEPFVGQDGKHYCYSDSKYEKREVAKPCSNQGNH